MAGAAPHAYETGFGGSYHIRWADVRKKSAVAVAEDQHRRKVQEHARIANAANCPVIKLGGVSGRLRFCYAAGRERPRIACKVAGFVWAIARHVPICSSD